LYSEFFNGENSDEPEQWSAADSGDNNDEITVSAAGDCADSNGGEKGRYTLDEVTHSGQDRCKDLVRPCDIKGILHSHTRWTDGAHSLESMVDTAREIGLEYLGISDHFHSELHVEGLDMAAAAIQREEIERLKTKYDDFDILQGIEVDTDSQGNLMVDEGMLDQFEFVIASFPENGGYQAADFIPRVVRVAEHPQVTILGNPVGDFMLRGCEALAEMEEVLEAAVRGGTAVELNANPNSHKLEWTCCRLAQKKGVHLVISPNAHRAARLVDYRHGAELAHDAGLNCGSIINTMSSERLRHHLEHGFNGRC